jgi:hypothetical protein
MSIELATALYENIGKITHLRTFEFLKAIQENRDPDGFSRITYAKWRNTYRIHAFILNECTRECQELGFIEVGRENKGGLTTGGGKGIKRIYKLTLAKISNVIPNAEPPKENTDPVIEPEPVLPETENPKKSPVPATKFVNGKKISVNKKPEKKIPSKESAKKSTKTKTPKTKSGSIKKAPVKKVNKK